MRPAAGIAALGLLLVLVAGTFDAEPLYVAAVAFVALAGVAAAWVWAAARGVRVGRTLAARRVAEDEPLDVRVDVRVTGFGLPGGLVDDPILPEPLELPAGRRGRRVRIHARFSRRGRRVLDPPRVIVCDPLGLATRVVRGPVADEVLVLPRIEPVRPVGGGQGRDGVRRRGRPAMAAEVELDGVREHRPGTPASRIYWPALARGAGLMERRLRPEADATPLIVLDTRGAQDERYADDLDAAVRAVASLAHAMAKAGGVGVLLPGDRRPTTLDESLAAWTHLHARLALLEGGGRASLNQLSARVGPVLYVAARAPARTPRALEHAPASARTLVVPGTLPGRRPLFTVAGCTGYDVEPARVRAPRPSKGAVA
jgi:uncharacterized protein (DUF58 family)